MKILISEDRDSKFAKIKACLESEFSEVEIVRCTAAKETVLELINNNTYDVLIQDMQLPLNKNDRIDPNGGIYVFHQLERRHIKIKFIFCSSEDVSFHPDVKTFNQMQKVLFEETKTGWKSDLISMLK